MTDSPQTPMSQRDADQLAAGLADVQQLDLPLPEGLRAAAAESGRPRVAAALREVAERVEQGRSLAEAVAQMKRPLPPMLQGAFAAAARSPALADVLFDVLEHQNEGRWESRTLLASLLYPLSIFVVSVLLFCTVQLTIVRSFVKIFEDFELALPPITLALVWWSEIGALLLLAVVGLLASTVLSARLVASRERMHRVLGALPLAGSMWRNSGHAELTRLLGMLVERQVPLAQAIGLASDCCSNADAAEVWRRTAPVVARGGGLGEAVARQPRIPAQVLPFLAWGQRSGQLPDALAAVSDLLAEQSRDSAMQLRLTVPPLLFLVVLCALAATVVSIIAPLMALLAWF